MCKQEKDGEGVNGQNTKDGYFLLSVPPLLNQPPSFYQVWGASLTPTQITVLPLA